MRLVDNYVGSTSSFYQIQNGMILKVLYPALAERDAYKVTVEKKILERLGEHSRIIKYMGFYEDTEIRGLLFVEASHGNLQQYLDQNKEPPCLPVRKRWCVQATEGVQYLHCNGVIHSDLRPENCLLHRSETSLDILLCDFGGSMCRDLDLDGKGLPDPPFWDLVWESTAGTDIFSLGSIFYTIMTAHWPYKSSHAPQDEEDRWRYEDRVMNLLKQGVYPSVDNVTGGTIMMGCWQKRYVVAEDVLQAAKDEMWNVTTTGTVPPVVAWVTGGCGSPG